MSAPLQVILNVYDLHESNRMLHSLGVGFFHTGVEINGYEFSFCGNGVVRTRPRLPDFGNFREQIVIGIYNGGMQGVYASISTLRNDTFQPGAYHPTNLNCNHFSDAFCMALVGQHIPNWINRAARIGSTMGVVAPTNSESRGAGAVEAFAAPGKVKSPGTAAAVVKKDKDPPAPTAETISITSSIFSWFGWGQRDTAVIQNSETTPSIPVRGQSSSQANKKPTEKKELTEKQKMLLAKMKK